MCIGYRTSSITLKAIPEPAHLGGRSVRSACVLRPVLAMTDSHSFLPESAPASPVPDSVSQNEVSNADPTQNDAGEQENDLFQADFSHLSAAHRDTMHRLAQRVHEAVNTIEELRSENDRLRQRIEELEAEMEELEAEPDFPDDETILALDDDPNEVRERITQFINTIDTYLDTTAPTSGNDPVEDPVDDTSDA